MRVYWRLVIRLWLFDLIFLAAPNERQGGCLPPAQVRGVDSREGEGPMRRWKFLSLILSSWPLYDMWGHTYDRHFRVEAEPWVKYFANMLHCRWPSLSPPQIHWDFPASCLVATCSVERLIDPLSPEGWVGLCCCCCVLAFGMASMMSPKEETLVLNLLY